MTEELADAHALSESVARTVLGDIAASELGHVAPHEHILIDLARPPARGLSVTDREEFYLPIGLDTYHRVRRSNRNMEDRRLISEADAIFELLKYRGLGGDTIVDVTSLGLGRDPEGLARISRECGVHIVMGAGYYVREFHPAEVASNEAEELADRITADVLEGSQGTGIRAGIIGEIGMTWPTHPDEDKVLRAAALAQRRTGAALMIHPGRHYDAPFTHLDGVEAAGVDPARVVMCHIERTYFDAPSILRLAERGCYIEFDLFGQESSYYPFAPIDMPNDASRVDLICELLEAGYRDQILISQDIYRKTCLTRYGGEGYGHILSAIVPLMRRKGLSVTDIDTICRTNPATMLAIRNQPQHD